METTRPLFDVTTADLGSIEGIIKALATDFCKRFDYAVFDDLVQEGWALFYKYAPRYYDPKLSKLTTWFYTCYKRQLISLLQRDYSKISKLESIQQDDEGETTRDFEDVKANPVADVIHSELTKSLALLASPLAGSLLVMIMTGEVTKLTSSVAGKLGVSGRDLVYLREELQQLTRFLSS